MDSRCFLIGAICLALPILPATARGLAIGPAGMYGALYHGGGYLGVNLENPTNQQRVELGVGANGGVVIAAVDHDAPAGKAGLLPNDVITRLNGEAVRQVLDLQRILAKMGPGQAVTLNILRQGHPMTINLVLANRKAVERRAWSEHYMVPDPHAGPTQQTGFSAPVPSEARETPGANTQSANGPDSILPYTGIDLERMSLQLSRYFGVADSTGLLARSIDPNSPGSRAGIKAGDVICQANGVPLTSRDGWDEVLRVNRGQAIRLKILRNRHPRTVLLVLSGGHS